MTTFVPSILQRGDTLASLASLYCVSAADIAEANGVPKSLGVGSCAWGRAIFQWVLDTGGIEEPVVASQKNACVPGRGFSAFVEGQVIMLPDTGLRATVAPPASTASGSSWLWLLLLGIGGAAAALKGR